MRLMAQNLCRQPCRMNPGAHSVSTRVLPARCLKCTAMAKGFADRSVTSVDVPTGESKQRLRKKVDRRKRISHELEELQAAELQVSARAPLPQSQQSNGSQPSSARPTQQQQQLHPEEVASLAKKLQEEVMKLQEEIRSSTFYRYPSIALMSCFSWPTDDMVYDVSVLSAMCRGFLATLQGAQKPAADAESAGESSTSGESSRPVVLLAGGVLIRCRALLKSDTDAKIAGLLQIWIRGIPAGDWSL